MTVRLLFTRRHALGSLFLRTALWSSWSHVAIIDGDEVIEATGSGVRVWPLRHAIADASEHEIVAVPCTVPDGVIAAARSQIGKPYDWGGVLGIGFRRRWQDEGRWFCSELVAWAFHHAGVPIVRVQAWRITPRDLYLPAYSQACP